MQHRIVSELDSFTRVCGILNGSSYLISTQRH